VQEVEGGVDKRRLWPACSRHIVLPLDTIKSNGKIFEIVKLSIKTRQKFEIHFKNEDFLQKV